MTRLASLLLACALAAQPAPPQALPAIEVAAYMGTWYQTWACPTP